MVCFRRPLLSVVCASLVFAPAVVLTRAAGPEPKLEELLEQNHSLLLQVQNQQKQIDELRRRLDAMNGPGTPPARMRPPREAEAREPAPVLRSVREIRLSAEAGLAFFSSGRQGAFPNSEFRVDDAKIFVEAPVWRNVYFFTGLELTTREANDEFLHVGELYADVEDVLAAGRTWTLSLRVGRFNIPFGEEYQRRNVMDNPLITHSVADIWGIDEGVQAYGKLGPLTYNIAVQNGGHKTLRDFNKDKAVTVRLGFAPTPALHVSASGYRSGKLDAVNDPLSEIWFSGQFFRPLGPAATTRTYQASLFELDAAWQWKEGHFKATGGTAWFDDDSTTADYSRRLHFYSFELQQQMTAKLYGAARYSEVRAPRGYPLAGLGDGGRFFFNPFATPTTDLHRLSLGLSWRFAEPVIWKLEYSWENGRLTNGVPRDQEDLLATELALKF